MRQVIKASLLLMLFIVTSLIFTVFVSTLQHNRLVATEVSPRYGIRGLPYGRELSQDIQRIDDRYVYFNDRILEIFVSDSTQNQEAIVRIQSFMDVLPAQVNRVLALIPMAITYESYVEDALKTGSLEAIAEIQQSLDESIQWIDVDRLYASNVDDYLYLRTDPRITTMGAYHIAQAFLQNKGIQPIPLEAYLEDRRTKIQGIYFYLEHADLIMGAEDNGIFYLLEGASNRQEITIRLGSGETRTYESPTISVSRRGLDVFIGGNLSDSKLYGDATGSSVVVIGDYSAKALGTWLTPYFEHVFVINSAFYTKSKEDFFKLFENYQISDVILIESIDNMIDSSMNSKLKMIYE